MNRKYLPQFIYFYHLIKNGLLLYKDIKIFLNKMEQSELIKNIKSLDKPGRDKTKKLCEKLGYKWGEPDNEKLAYDCYFIYKGKKYLVEIKDRNPEYDKYDELILEVDKYNRVENWKNRLNANGCYYINWFGDKCYIFNLDDSYITEHKDRKIMNRVTAASRVDKCYKDVYLVDKNKAKIYYL